MFIQNNGKSKNLIEGNRKRKDSIRGIIKENAHKSIINKLFLENDFHKFHDILENELFYEIIPGRYTEKLFGAIRGNLSEEAFIEEFEKSGEFGAMPTIIALRL